MSLTRRGFLSALAGAAAAGCSRVNEPEEVGWRPLRGAEHKTPNYWIPFWWVGPAGGIATPEQAGVEIERVYAEWRTLYLSKWNDLEEWELILSTYKVNIQLFAASRIPGATYDPDYHTLGIWWYEHNQIDTAMAAPYHYDAALGIYTKGLEQLKHEWTHCAKWRAGDTWFHP